jgi:NAD(P)H-dependent FMN reductase
VSGERTPPTPRSLTVTPEAVSVTSGAPMSVATTPISCSPEAAPVIPSTTTRVRAPARRTYPGSRARRTQRSGGALRRRSPLAYSMEREVAMSLRLVVVYGSVRSARQGIRVARFVVNECRARGHEVTLVDPLDYPLPFLDKMYKEYPRGEAPEMLERLAALIVAADAVVVVSGEYNHSIPPALSNLLDHFLEEWFWKPSAIVCYSAGPFGGVRAAMQLRMMLGELGMASIPSIFPVPEVQDAVAEDGTPTDPTTHDRVQKFLDELEWYGHALREARNRPLERGNCAAQQLVGTAR